MKRLTLCLALVTASLVAAQSSRIPDTELQSFIEQRLYEWQPKREEKRFDEIGWAVDIREAERLGRQSGRPLFLFTHDGRINTGRC